MSVVRDRIEPERGHGSLYADPRARRRRRDRVGHVSDETTNRGFWRHDGEVMAR